MSVAVILGSSFDQPELAEHVLEPVDVPASGETVRLYRYRGAPREAYVLFRHGMPHAFLPNQIPYRAHAAALRQVGCEALLVTSSVGVVDPSVPLFTPLVVADLFMPDNRLPDGSACTMFTRPVALQGHLVIEEGLFARALSLQLDHLAGQELRRVVFAYVGGPRTKTATENRWLAQQGAQVNSMTLGPEVVLANELEIPTAALVIGHKYSLPIGAPQGALAPDALKRSLVRARAEVERLVTAFLEAAQPTAFANRMYRF